MLIHKLSNVINVISWSGNAMGMSRLDLWSFSVIGHARVRSCCSQLRLRHVCFCQDMFVPQTCWSRFSLWITQSPKNVISMLALPTGKLLIMRPESFLLFYKIAQKMKYNHHFRVNKFIICLETFQAVCKVSGQSGKFVDSFKVSRLSKRFPYGL